MKKFLNIALGITYFGDYCSLIGLMEYAKRFSQSDRVVSIYIVYCLPALIMSFVANKWAQRQQHPEKQMAIFAAIGAIGGLSLLGGSSYGYILIVSGLLGFVKEATQILMNVYIKFNFEENEAKKAVNNIVITRFFIMVFGGSLGGYLGEKNWFNSIFLIDATTFFIAGVIFFYLKPLRPVVSEVGKNNISPFRFTRGMVAMIASFGFLPFVWFVIAEIGIGSFYGMEYPLITTEFQIAPKLLGFIWFWHVLGTILSKRFSQKILDQKDLIKPVIFSNMAFVLAAASIGLFGKSILIIGLQIGILAFISIILEVFSSYHLMKESSKDIFPYFNLYFRIARQLSIFLGSIFPVILLQRYSMLETNILICLGLFAIGAMIVVAFRFIKKPISLDEGQISMPN